MRGDRGLVRRLSLGLAAASSLLIAPAPHASGAVTIGQTFPPAGNCNAGFTHLQAASPAGRYTVPTAGVITSWSFQASAAAPRLKFKLGRPAGGNSHTVLAESGVVSPGPGLNTFPVQIAALPGDVIGLYVVAQGNCLREDATPDYVDSLIRRDVAPSSTALFTPVLGLQLAVSASLETQRCTGQAPTIAGTPGNDTLIGTGGPDVIVGLGGRDRIKGLGGADRICGGPGRDILKGGRGKDILEGGPGGDTLVGGKGRDKLLGQGGRDRLRGSSGKDVCKGGKKRDRASGCEVEKGI